MIRIVKTKIKIKFVSPHPYQPLNKLPSQSILLLFQDVLDYLVQMLKHLQKQNLTAWSTLKVNLGRNDGKQMFLAHIAKRPHEFLPSLGIHLTL